MSVICFKSDYGRRCLAVVATLVLLGACSVDHARAESLTWPFSLYNAVSPLELAQQQADPPQALSLKLPPTSSAELWSRWLDLLRETGGSISKEQFERVIGLTLPELKEESNGSVQYGLSIGGERFLIAIVNSSPKQSFRSASISWRLSTFGDKCIADAQVAKDLSQLGWRQQPPGHHAKYWKEFRNGMNVVTYSSTAEGCSVSAQTCRSDPLFSPLCGLSQNGAN